MSDPEIGQISVRTFAPITDYLDPSLAWLPGERKTLCCKR